LSAVFDKVAIVLASLRHQVQEALSQNLYDSIAAKIGSGSADCSLSIGARQVGILAAATATAGTANAGNAAALVTSERRDRSDM
jgi:hypothetical protein